ncbi:hypothetical protein D9M68_926230 [compost metagenome]
MRVDPDVDRQRLVKHPLSQTICRLGCGPAAPLGKARCEGQNLAIFVVAGLHSTCPRPLAAARQDVGERYRHAQHTSTIGNEIAAEDLKGVRDGGRK